EADSLIYNTEKLLRDLGDKVTASEKAQVEQEIESLRNVAKGEDAQAIKSSCEKLTSRLHELSSRLYAQAQAQQAEGGAADSAQAPGGAPHEGPTVDAEFRDQGKV
ncbi:MAG TPA: Hsp70 family protein, partial [Thermosynergistes sp.]|nr:Hsp70 family protein [Thermosynergistes sp.]